MKLSLSARRALLRVEPRTPGQLRSWLACALGVEVPSRPHGGPLAYLWHAFHEPATPKPDAVVWACRGGGKTFYAALATTLDLIFKPGIEVKVLAGSVEQGSRLHAHLRRFFESDLLRPLVDGRVTDRRLRLLNGSVCEVLAQSPTSVRGARPQKLRCDEAELFDPGVWAAAQMCVRSAVIDGRRVHASVEALSTCHEPFGLMSEIIATCNAAPGARRLFKWGVTDVLERCPPERDCNACPIQPECAGRAKRALGHITIDDAIAMKSRVSAADWRAEMLCERPTRRDAVYPEFDAALHVGAFDPPEDAMWIAGMDFGFRAPTVFLWAFLHAGVLHVADEHARTHTILDDHVREILARPWPRPSWVGIDPAGHQREGQSGVSHASILREAGLVVRSRRSGVESGLRLVRARLASASGPPTIRIHPRCVNLIESLTRYRYPPDSHLGGASEPLKDGADHAADALRYMVLALDARDATTVSNYLAPGIRPRVTPTTGTTAPQTR